MQGGHTKYEPRTDQDKANAIFLHYTASGTGILREDASPQTKNGLNDVNNHRGPSSGPIASHFILLKDGRAIQIFGLDKEVYTQGTSFATDTVPDVNGFPGSVLALEKAAQGVGNGNDYGYSIECVSAAYDWGKLTEKQINSVHFLIRYIHYFARLNYQVNIPIQRVWEGFPDLPEPREEEVVPGFLDFEGNPFKRATRYYTKVYGNLLGHNDISQQACPGGDFPWREILSRFGIYPGDWGNQNTAELQKIRTDTNDQYEKLAKYEANKKALLAERLPQGLAAPTAEEIKEALGPEPSRPYYRDNSVQWDKVDEFIVWGREYDEIYADTDIEASMRKFLEEEKGFQKNSYEVVNLNWIEWVK